MGYLAREARAMTEEDLHAMLLDGAGRILSGAGRETAGDSMDCDYGHELMDAALKEIKHRAATAGAEGRCYDCGMGSWTPDQQPNRSWSGCPTCGWCY